MWVPRDCLPSSPPSLSSASLPQFIYCQHSLVTQHSRSFVLIKFILNQTCGGCDGLGPCCRAASAWCITHWQHSDVSAQGSSRWSATWSDAYVYHSVWHSNVRVHRSVICVHPLAHLKDSNLSSVQRVICALLHTSPCELNWIQSPPFLCISLDDLYIKVL